MKHLSLAAALRYRAEDLSLHSIFLVSYLLSFFFRELRPEDVLHLAAMPQLEQLILRRFRILSHSFHLPSSSAEKREDSSATEADQMWLVSARRGEKRSAAAMESNSANGGFRFPRLAKLNFIRVRRARRETSVWNEKKKTGEGEN